MDFLGKILRVFFRGRKKGFPSSPAKVLVFKPGAIGDILWTTPFLRHLRKTFPKSEIVYCVGKWSQEVLIGNPNIDRIIAIDDRALMRKNVSYAISLIRALRKERFDVAFTFEKHYLSNLLVMASGAKVSVGFDRSGEGFPLNITAPYGNDKHEIEYDLDLLGLMGGWIPQDKEDYVSLFGKDYFRTEVFPTKEEKEKVDSLFKRNKINGKIIGLAPGGGKNTGQETMFRRWPLERYASLAKALLSKKYKVILFGGPSDIDLVKSFDNRCTDLIGMLNPRESILAMGKCDHFICNDSGPMNMAAAAKGKVRIISLFGPTRPSRKAPMDKRHTAIWKDSDIYYPEYDLRGEVRSTAGFMERISVKDVLNSILKK